MLVTSLGDDAAMLTPPRARAAFRGGHSAPTAGWANGFAQANLIAVPREWAYDVLLFCQRNPKPCPVLDVTEPGAWTTPLAEGSDLRTDIPRYRVWRDGLLVDEPTEVRDLWTDDLVGLLRDRSRRGRRATAPRGSGAERAHVRHQSAMS
jgi:uncharacterized protein YcsI (UPF0317 family)